MFFAFEEISESSDEEKNKKHNLVLERKLLRQKTNIFNLPDDKFENYFRLSKTAFKYVLDMIAPNLKNGIRSTFISKHNKLAATLRFLAEGTYDIRVGNDFNLALSQPMFSKILSETLDALEISLCPQWIKLKMTDVEKNEAKLTFFEKTEFPGIIGCVGGTHIKITAPNKEDQHLYCNSKGFFSLNAMIICDHQMRILFLDARYAGSAQDSLVWQLSHAKRLLHEGYNAGDRNSWLLGDACYPLEPYLMTPYNSAAEGSAEDKFNRNHAKARSVIERTIVVLKNRFKCLLGERQLYYKPAKVSKMVNVCAALHNVCIAYNLGITDDIAYGSENTTDVELGNIEFVENIEALEIREQIKKSFL